MIKNKKEKPQKRAGDTEIQGMSPTKAQKRKRGKSAADAVKINNEKLSNSNNISAKKRKMEGDKTEKKKLKTKHHQETEEGKSLTYKVVFPEGETCYKEAIRKVLNSADSVLRPGYFTIKFGSEEEAKQKSAALEKISVGGSHLFVSPVFRTINSDPLKRLILLSQTFQDKDKLQKFYGATAVEQALSSKGNLSHKFVLSFESEAKATAASKKLFKFGNKDVPLRSFSGEKGSPEERKKLEQQNTINGKKQNQKGQQQKKSDMKEQKKQNKQKQQKGKKFDHDEKLKMNLDLEGDNDDDDDDSDEE